jgi:hypothetical protein
VPEIAQGQVNVPIAAERAGAQLGLGGALEFAAAQVIGLDAALRRRALLEEVLKDLPLDADDPAIFAESHSELHGAGRVVPLSIIGKREQIHLPLCSRSVCASALARAGSIKPSLPVSHLGGRVELRVAIALLARRSEAGDAVLIESLFPGSQLLS